MELFFETVDTIADGLGFSVFGGLHLAWLIAAVIIITANAILYHKLDFTGRIRWRRIVAWLLIADELFKMAILIFSGNYGVGYLPFHLCSINIFLIALHAYKPSPVLGNFLYTVCIPGAIAALLFPTWTELPICNGMHLHSFTVHILLAMYSAVLAINGTIKPDMKILPKSLGLLLLMAIPIYGINLWLDTNFMFLMSADPGNPLYLFEQMWGSHLLGFPVIIAGVLLVMYGPVALVRKLKKEKSALS